MTLSRKQLKRVFLDPDAFNNDSLLAIESLLGRRLNDETIEFLRDFNGSEAEFEYSFDLEPGNASSLCRFYSVQDIMKHFDFEVSVAGHTLPIADDGCGNFVYVNPDKGFAVYFQDNDEPRPDLKLAETIGGFLAKLECREYEIPEEILKAAKVTINPDAEKNTREWRARWRKKLQ